MHSDMLLLTERLVIAMEAMSQDVKNMSAYIYDISCSVSYLLNEKRRKESISDAAFHEGDSPSSDTAEQYDLAVERSSSYIGDLEDGENSFGDTAPMSIDLHENSYVASNESKSFLSEGIKIEEQSENEVNEESNDVRILEEMKTETQLETEREDQTYSLHTTIGHFMGQSMPSELTARMDIASDPVPHKVQSTETPSNSAIDNGHNSFVSRLPEGQTFKAKTHQIKIAKDTLTARTRVDSKQRPHKCSVCEKSFMIRRDLQNHIRVHTGERPYKCNVCGKAFTQSGSLTHHIRSHTGERPYSCNVCGNTCTQKTHLNVHMRIHTGVNPYKCNVCGKAFRHSYKLTQHMCTHSREHPN